MTTGVRFFGFSIFVRRGEGEKMSPACLVPTSSMADEL